MIMGRKERCPPWQNLGKGRGELPPPHHIWFYINDLWWKRVRAQYYESACDWLWSLKYYFFIEYSDWSTDVKHRINMAASTEVKVPAKSPTSFNNYAGIKSLIVFGVLALAWLAGFSSRLFAVIRFESIIHEFDPWWVWFSTPFSFILLKIKKMKLIERIVSFFHSLELDWDTDSFGPVAEELMVGVDRWVVLPLLSHLKRQSGLCYIPWIGWTKLKTKTKLQMILQYINHFTDMHSCQVTLINSLEVFSFEN